MNSEALNKLRNYYKEEPIAEEKVDALWQDLSRKLPDRQYHPYHFVTRYAAMTIALVLFFTSGLFAISVASPATPFYPIRLLSEEVTAKLSGRYDSIIERKTDQIINAAQKTSDTEIKKAAADYKKTLHEATAVPQENTKAKERLKQTLKTSETRLNSVTPANQNNRKALQESIKQTKDSQQEVKSAHTESQKEVHPKNSNNPGTENKPDNPSTENSGSGSSNSQGNGKIK